MDPFKATFNQMFKVSETPTKFYNRKKDETVNKGGIRDNEFDLPNLNAYDIKDGKLFKAAFQGDYNTIFLLDLERMHTPNVKAYLEHHYTQGKNSKAFFEYVKYCILPSEEIIRQTGKVSAISDWIKSKEELQENNIIFHELIGASGKHNTHNTVQPVFHYIKDVLKKYNLSAEKAKEIVNDMKGSASPEWNKNVVPHIISYLKEAMLQPQQTETEQEAPQTFAEIFVDNDYEKYIVPLTECTPQLLKREKDKFMFVGNKKTQRGCVAQWFKFLKLKGKIVQSVSRDELASVLSNEIKDFTINGSSIDNESATYTKTFEASLTQQFNKIN